MAIFFKKMKIFGNFFEKMSSFCQFFDSQMAIFRRVRYGHRHGKQSDDIHADGVRDISMENISVTWRTSSSWPWHLYTWSNHNNKQECRTNRWMNWRRDNLPIWQLKPPVLCSNIKVTAFIMAEFKVASTQGRRFAARFSGDEEIREARLRGRLEPGASIDEAWPLTYWRMSWWSDR